MAMASSGYHHFDHKKDYHHQWPCYANEYIAMLCIWSSITTGVTLCRDGGSILMLRDASATISDCCATENTMLIKHKFNTNTTQLKARNGAIICYSPPLSVALPWFCSVSLASLNRVTPWRGGTAHWEMNIFSQITECICPKYENVFVQKKCICPNQENVFVPNKKMYFSKLQDDSTA